MHVASAVAPAPDKYEAINQHATVLLAHFRDLYTMNVMFDVTVCCDNVFVCRYVLACNPSGASHFSAHRLVLAAFSQHFEQALVSTESLKSIRINVDPAVTGVAPDTLRSVIDWMYTGLARASDAQQLMAAARALGINRLLDVYIAKQFSSAAQAHADDYDTLVSISTADA